MMNKFRGFCGYSEEELKSLWEQCIFVFDTNVLLNLYRYTLETQTKFIEILKKLNDRIWIPNQVAKEFFENRITVISAQQETYQQVIDRIGFSSIKGRLSEIKRHKTIDFKAIENILDRCESEIKQLLNKAQEKHKDYYNEDEILKILLDLFDNKVGESYQEDTLKNYYKLAEERFKKEIPPGYKDRRKAKTSKDPNRQYNDYIIWEQIIDYAKGSKKPIIFIIDDVKEDWWLENKGKLLGPRPELVDEFIKKAEVDFYMYQSERFLSYAWDRFGMSQSEKVILEIKELKASNPNQVDSYLNMLRYEDDNDNDYFDIYANRYFPTRKIFQKAKEHIDNIKNDIVLQKHATNTRDAVEFYNENKEIFGNTISAQMISNTDYAEYHLFLTNEDGKIMYIEGGCTSGYSGTGPNGTYKVLKGAGFDISKEFIVENRSFILTKKINE